MNVGKHVRASDGGQLPDASENGRGHAAVRVPRPRQEHPDHRIDVRLDELLGGGNQQREEHRALFFSPRYVRVLELGQELDERLPERGHHVSWVHQREPADYGDGGLSNGEDLIVERQEQGSDVLGLGEMAVEPRVKRQQHRAPNLGLSSGQSATREQEKGNEKKRTSIVEDQRGGWGRNHQNRRRRRSTASR